MLLLAVVSHSVPSELVRSSLSEEVRLDLVPRSKLHLCYRSISSAANLEVAETFVWNKGQATSSTPQHEGHKIQNRGVNDTKSINARRNRRGRDIFRCSTLFSLHQVFVQKNI